MKSYYNSGDIKLLKGDSLQLLKKIEKGFQKFIHSPFKEKNN